MPINHDDDNPDSMPKPTGRSAAATKNRDGPADWVREKSNLKNSSTRYHYVRFYHVIS